MSVEKKHWRLSTPFRRFSRQPNASSGSCVSSVYLSDNSSPSNFIIAPEFDYPAQTHMSHETHHSRRLWPELPVVASPSPSLPHGVDGYPNNPRSTNSRSCDAAIIDTCRTDDLSQRLDLAYELIRRSVPTAALPQVHLSSDPQTLRKQLGVPQHSVFNYPIHSSPDLPNPHDAPLKLLSPESKPATSDSNMYPPSSPRDRAISISTLMKDPGVLETPSSVHITCTPKTQSSAQIVESRAVESTFLASLPHPCRQTLKDTLPRPGADTASLVNTYRQQISQPRIAQPLSHKQLHRACSRRSNGSTEALASLAWIGSLCLANQRPHPTSRSSSLERFSMEIAVEDDMSDNALIDRLEKARRTNDPSERIKDASPSISSSSAHVFSTKGDGIAPSAVSSPPSSPPTSDQFDRLKYRGAPLASLSLPRDVISGSEDVLWKTVRKALFCTREIVRTEKRYQEALKMLLNAQTATPPPPSMSPYVSALVQVSEMLLKRFLEDPSAWGVSTAFLTSEDELEATMVSWCTVAGTFFTDASDSKSNKRWRLRKSGAISVLPPSSATKRMSIAVSPQQVVGEHGARQHLTSEPKKQRSGVSLQKLECPTTACQPPSRKLSVRDLAIQPIQRVVRYVLLYRDLLDYTPVTSPAHLLVERALGAATRIANHCDRAQRNPAFCAS